LLSLLATALPLLITSQVTALIISATAATLSATTRELELTGAEGRDACGITDAVIHIPVEVHTDSFEEAVGHADEANFHSHLKVLQFAKLGEQIHDLFVHRRGLTNHKAQRVFFLTNRSLSSIDIP